MAQRKEQSPSKSDSSSASSWIDLNSQGKHAVVPNSNNLPLGHHPTRASTVYGGAQPIRIQPLTPVSPKPDFTKMLPHPAPRFNLFGVRAGDEPRQQLALHPIPHRGHDSLATSLIVGPTALHDMPVVAFVSDTVRSCCATERHALLRGHPGCLFAYRRAAELWGLAQEVRAKHKSDTKGTISQPSGSTLHPYGAIGEKTCGRDTQNHTPSPITATASALPTPPPVFGELASPPPGYVRRLIGFGPTAPGEFRPMFSVNQARHATGNGGTPQHDATEPTGVNQDITRAPRGQSHQPAGTDATEAERTALGYSPRYQGNIWLPTNRSANIPDSLNCSLFLIHLPPDLTAHGLLAAIHKLGPTGRIYALHINAPEPARGNLGCAAKVVFFTRAAAHLFFRLCQQLGGFYVGGRRAHVTWNRIKTAERPDLVDSDASRVLLISGPRAIVNPRTLTDFFRTKLEFQVDEVLVLEEGGKKGGLTAGGGGGGGGEEDDHHHRDALLAFLRRHHGSPGCYDDDNTEDAGCDDAIIEYRFGSFRCQAQAAKMALARVLPQIRCFFGEDPLAPEAWRHHEYKERRAHDSYTSKMPVLDSLRL